MENYYSRTKQKRRFCWKWECGPIPFRHHWYGPKWNGVHTLTFSRTFFLVWLESIHLANLRNRWKWCVIGINYISRFQNISNLVNLTRKDANWVFGNWIMILRAGFFESLEWQILFTWKTFRILWNKALNETETRSLNITSMDFHGVLLKIERNATLLGQT